MARPKKVVQPEPEMVQTETVAEHVPAPEPVVMQAPPPPAPVAPPVPPAPRQMRIERSGVRTEPYTRRFPQVRGGVCEYCGILNPNDKAENQYKYCEHFRGMQLMCSYCPPEKNPDDVVYHENLNIAAHPNNPEMLVVWCGSYECSRAHEQRFKINR